MNLPKAPAGVYVDREQLLQMRFVAKDITLNARKKSLALQEGSVRTRYKGRGMEFSEVRPYQAGDDIRTIDWRVTARMQNPYTKLFQEERERPVFTLIDQRSPMFFGSRNEFKSVYAAKLAAAIGWAANAHSDRIGALVFGDTEQRDIRAKRSKHAVLELINQVTEVNHKLQSPFPPNNAMDLLNLLTETSRIARPGSLIALISDFHDFNDRCIEPLSQLGKTSDVLAFHLFDPLERTLPPVGQLKISNGQQRTSINTQVVGQSFSKNFDHRQAYLRQSCLQVGVQYIRCDIATPLNELLMDLFGRKNGKSRPRTPSPTEFQP